MWRILQQQILEDHPSSGSNSITLYGRLPSCSEKFLKALINYWDVPIEDVKWRGREVLVQRVSLTRIL
jgi:hypothetical protein